MAELIDVKLPKKTKEELKEEMGMGMPEPSTKDQEQWPYGLKLDFEKEEVDKIPSLKSLNVGDKVSIQAEASVIEVRVSERQGGEDRHNVCIQIEKVSVEPLVKKKPEQMNMKEYKAMRMNK